MSRPSLRRIQVSCIALAHIPLVAVGAALFRDGMRGDIATIASAFLATLITAVLLAAYLRRAVEAAREPRAATPGE